MYWNQKCLLIVDDEDDICQIVKEKFEHLGCKVLVAHSVHEGFQFAEAEKPDCVLLDICIPGSEGGLGFLRRLRTYCHRNLQKQTCIREIPVIMITGAGLTMKPLFEREKISGFIDKPFDLTNLQTRIEHILQIR